MRRASATDLKPLHHLRQVRLEIAPQIALAKQAQSGTILVQ